MSLASEVIEYARAAFAGIWVRTSEDAVALAEIQKLCSEQRFLYVLYDISEGVDGDPSLMGGDGMPSATLKFIGADGKEATETVAVRLPQWNKSPTRFLRDVPLLLEAANDNIRAKLVSELDSADEEQIVEEFEKIKMRITIAVIRNGHFSTLTPPEMHVQLMQNLLVQGKNNSFRFVVTSPRMAIPMELERYFVVVDQSLPCKTTLRTLAEEMCEQDDDKPETEEEWTQLMEAAAGLTVYEAESAYALSIIRNRKLDVSTVWDVKSQTVKKRGLLEIYQGGDSFDNMGGLRAFKDFHLKLLGSRQDNTLIRPKGSLLVGVPGAGKSGAVKCLGNATGRRVLTLDLSRIRSKFQGESENNLLDAVRIADSMQPCILFVDEVEKGLSGAGSGGETDSGVSDRMFGSFLTWLNDHTSDVFVVATCNKVSILPPEFARAERFDAMFFFDLPTPSERRAIWTIYLDLFGLPYEDSDLEEYVKLSKKWTGAEIRTCCRLAKMLEQSVADTTAQVTIIANTAPESLLELRRWATGRCLSTSKAGIYVMKDEDVATTGKKVTVKPKRKLVRDNDN